WCEWCMPEVSSGLEGSEESLYRLWLFQLAARRSGVVREDVLLSSRVIPFADGEITSQFPGLGAALMRWDRMPAGVEELAPVYAGWTAATAWPESQTELILRTGFAGLTYQPRRRMIAEPGTALAEAFSLWRARIRPGGLALEFHGGRVIERGTSQAVWHQTSAPFRAAGDVAVVRYERTPPSFARLPVADFVAEPSQSVAVIVRLHERGEEDLRPSWGVWVTSRLAALLEADPSLRTGDNADRARQLLRVLIYIPLRDAREDLRALLFNPLPGNERVDVHHAAMLVRAAHGLPVGSKWLEEASDADIERGLVALDLTTPLARAELWSRVLRRSELGGRRAALRRLDRLVRDSSEHLASFVGMLSRLPPEMAELEFHHDLRSAVRTAQSLRADREPSTVVVVAPYVVLIMAALALLLALTLTVGAVKGAQKPWLGLTGFVLGWLLTGQQLFQLPDHDFFVECVGLLLVWRSLVALAPVGGRRELAAPARAVLAALIVTIIEKAEGDTDVFGRLAIALCGIALVVIPFWVDRLVPQSTGRWRWIIPVLVTLILVPTVFVATVQGPALDQYMEGSGEARVWGDISTASLALAYLSGLVLVFASVVAYVRRAARTG
ncbi:MAG: hypothetical protein QNJ98_20670, partial [Planctomycetota bacterium]|nr:hypothetical protein [Planctomycetota bacterium]